MRLHRVAGSAARLEIIDGPDHVQQLFTLTGLRQLLQFTPTTDAPGEHPV